MDYEMTQVLYRLRSMPTSIVKLESAQDAVRLADTHNDVEAGYEFRQILTEEAMYAGRPDLTLVSMGWLLAQSDRDPEEFPDERLLWRYKWAIHHMMEFPEVSLARVESALEDMTARYERNGISLRPIHQQRTLMGVRTGNRALVETWRDRWLRSPRDAYADCKACDKASEVDVHFFMGEEEQGLAAALEIINGSARCASVPHGTFSRVLLPLLERGKTEEAAEFHRRGYAMIRGIPRFVDTCGRHLIFLTLIKDHVGAVRLFDRHVGLALDSTSPIDRLRFYLAAAFFLHRLKKTARGPRKLGLPSHHPLYNEAGRYDVGELADWYLAETRALADRFDRRDGNTHNAENIDRTFALERLIA